VAPHDSILWGDILISGQEVLDSGIFRVLSHNVNGLSKACHQADVLNFARAMKDKAVSLFGIQETNRNFERAAMLESFHTVIRGVSSHHQGVISSAKLQLDTDYQPGGTAISIWGKWASRFLAKDLTTLEDGHGSL